MATLTEIFCAQCQSQTFLARFLSDDEGNTSLILTCCNPECPSRQGEDEDTLTVHMQFDVTDQVSEELLEEQQMN